VGHSYSINPFKKRIKNHESDDDADIPEDKTFFCSELMAKAFKRFGIIKNDKTSCSKYFPVHFSTKSENFLKLTKYTSISEEQNIIISNKTEG
jgi:hypothetical protein